MRSLKKKRWKKQKLNIILTIIVCVFGVLIGNFLKIGFAESNDEDYTLINGFAFYWTLVNLNNVSDDPFSSPSTDYTIKHIIFDKYTDEKYGSTGSVKSISWSSGKNVDNNKNGTIKLFNCTDNESVYILVKDNDKIFLNKDSSWMFSQICGVENIEFNHVIDTSKVETMEMMFDGCRSLKSLDLSDFDTSKVTNMSSMFSACLSLETLDLSCLETENVTDMSYMFSLTNFTDLDLSQLNTSNVTDMSDMFSRLSNIETIDLSSLDTRNVTNMNSMFYGSKFTGLDLSNFDTSNVTSMISMFYECPNLKSINLSSFDTSNVTSMAYMFNECAALETLDLSNFDTRSVTDMSLMFKDCNNLETIYVTKYDAATNKGWNTSSVTSFEDIFTNTPKLVGGNKTTSTTSDIQYAVIDSLTQPGYLTEKVNYTTDLNTSYNVNENKDLVISFNPGVNYITSLYLMNGENKIDLVENTDYSIVEGKLVLKADSLRTLGKVSYKLHIKNKGSVDKNIIDLSITDIPIENTNKGEVIEDNNAPKTGDAITRYVSLFTVSLISFILLTIMLFTKNKKCKEELEII